MMIRCLLAVIVLPTLLCAYAQAQGAVKIGAMIGKLKFTDIRSLPRTLDDFGKKKAFVIVFTSTECPLVKRYLPTLNALEKEYRAKDVQFVGINAEAGDTLIGMATQAVQHDVEFPFVKDFTGDCVRLLGVERTPEVVVLDADKRLCYRGRIDDQYRLGGVRKAPTTNDLKDAMDTVLAGRKVANAETTVDGCLIHVTKPIMSRPVNYAKDVAPILQKHCWTCHQTGGSAPFALTSYKQASTRAKMLAEVVVQERMPPWFASHEFGPFINRRALSEEERKILVHWVATAAPAGDLDQAPLAPKATGSKWLIGTPDVVLEAAEQKLPEKGDIPYRYAILPHVFLEDTWVQSVQIVPDNPVALHHCNMGFADVTLKFNESNFITGYVPGGEVMNLDSGVGYMIPKGSVLALQMHFVATGKPEKCKISVGLRFPRDVVQKRLHNIQLTTSKFAIPPGAPAHRVAASRVLDRDVVGVGLFAHMHLRGKDMTFTAHPPNAKADTLLVIPNYNFAWQIPYRWEPGKKQLPKGTRLECVAHYDNSAFNPYNPDPKATVRHGPQTHHEMMFGFFFYTDAAERLDLRVDPKTGVERKK